MDPNILIVAVISPLIIAIVAHLLGRNAKKQDWAREDSVRKRAEEAAANLVESNRLIAATAAETASRTFGQLDRIHTLVNSNMTAAMEDALGARVAQLVALEELLKLKQSKGEEYGETLDLIHQIKDDIARRRAELQDRLRVTKVAEAQLEQAEGGGVEAEWKEEVTVLSPLPVPRL